MQQVRPTCCSSWEESWSYCCRGMLFWIVLRILSSLRRGVAFPSALRILLHKIPYVFFHTLQIMIVIFTIGSPTYYSSWEKTWSYCCRGTPFSTMLRILNSLCRGVTFPSALAILFHAIPYIFPDSPDNGRHLHHLSVLQLPSASFSFRLKDISQASFCFLQASFSFLLPFSASSSFLQLLTRVWGCLQKLLKELLCFLSCCELLWTVLSCCEWFWTIMNCYPLL